MADPPPRPGVRQIPPGRSIEIHRKILGWPLRSGAYAAPLGPRSPSLLANGRVEMDNNTVERTMRPIALIRNNALFAGHDAGAANRATISVAGRDLQTQRHRATRLSDRHAPGHCQRPQTKSDQPLAAMELRRKDVIGAPLTPRLSRRRISRRVPPSWSGRSKRPRSTTWPSRSSPPIRNARQFWTVSQRSHGLVVRPVASARTPPSPPR